MPVNSENLLTARHEDCSAAARAATAAKVLLVAGAVYLIAFQYCRALYWRDPHSAFFDICNIVEWKYSLVREHEARHLTFIYNAPADGPELATGRFPPLMCAAALATVKRDKDHYFEAMVGSMLSGWDARECQALYRSRLFANTYPTEHPACDYIYLLKQCLKTYAPYIFILGDDVILAGGWLIKTLNGSHGMSRGPAARNGAWIYLRLFYTETSLSWSSAISPRYGTD
ncbi:uncharacterized protein N7482_001674 [Penicillium canariense]|uniref:Uncharacterized protein n=1 Tax=Penicillium canariense TaxID=189055 RepID=A0A9W9IG84_9EURO|nr:uncharacterized protein N7482_001674 [Penicillium canariense]KAJ5175797.1 hypothetical protein N7482_001674 [Penicillium canariense]